MTGYKKKHCFPVFIFRTYPDEWKGTTYANNHLPNDDIEKNLVLAGADYCRIVHNKDVDTDGQSVKPHIHWVVLFARAQPIDYMYELTGLKMIIPRFKKHYGDCLRYLCHLDNPEKVKYDCNDVTGNVDYVKLIETDFHLTYDDFYPSLLMLADGVIDYKEFYRRFPEFIYRPACVTSHLKQLSGEHIAVYQLVKNDTLKTINKEVNSIKNDALETLQLEWQRLFKKWNDAQRS